MEQAVHPGKIDLKEEPIKDNFLVTLANDIADELVTKPRKIKEHYGDQLNASNVIVLELKLEMLLKETKNTLTFVHPSNCFGYSLFIDFQFCSNETFAQPELIELN